MLSSGVGQLAGHGVPLRLQGPDPLLRPAGLVLGSFDRAIGRIQRGPQRSGIGRIATAELDFGSFRTIGQDLALLTTGSQSPLQLSDLSFGFGGAGRVAFGPGRSCGVGDPQPPPRRAIEKARPEGVGVIPLVPCFLNLPPKPIVAIEFDEEGRRQGGRKRPAGVGGNSAQLRRHLRVVEAAQHVTSHLDHRLQHPAVLFAESAHASVLATRYQA